MNYFSQRRKGNFTQRIHKKRISGTIAPYVFFAWKSLFMLSSSKKFWGNQILITRNYEARYIVISLSHAKYRNSQLVMQYIFFILNYDSCKRFYYFIEVSGWQTGIYLPIFTFKISM